MCDTMIALGNSTQTGFNILAKNSDRNPNEPQYYTFIPAADHDPGSRVKCTYIEVDQVPHTYALILSKPSWIWGGEMGTNEFGVTIGNEAIWTKLPYGQPALLGMDSLRLGLERGRTAAEAMQVIIDLLEKYGQGGNCAFDGEFYYHNTYLIADADEAWILETADRFWAAEKVRDIRSISNVMSVSQYDRIHPGAMAYAVAQGWCAGEKDFNFCTTFLDHFHPVDMGGTLRSGCTRRTITADAGKVTTETMLRALRNHNSNDPWESAHFSSPCMHACGPEGDCQSTASIIAVIRPNGKSTYWGTNMSIPCIAPFKPFWFDAFADDVVFPYDKQEEAMAAWLYREQINRAMVAGKLDEAAYKAELYALEQDWIARCAAVEDKDASTRKAFSEQISREEKAFIDKWIANIGTTAPKPRGSESYRSAWAVWDQKMGKNRVIAY
jgi:secernin